MIATRRKRRSPHDPIPPINLEYGDVAQQGEHVGVVAGCLPDRVLLWPVRWGTAERAADIPVTSWLDCAVLGNPRRAMVQASVLLDVPRAGQRRLGRFSDGLLELIQRAAARDADVAAMIRRWGADRDHRRKECTPPAKAL